MNRVNKHIFFTLFFSLLCTVTGVGIVVPLLPVYAHDLGAGGIYIGLIFGAFSLSRTFFLPYFGRLSDKKGRKPFITIGLLLYAVISFVFIFADHVESLIILRFFQGVASAMIMPVAQAYVGDITPRGKEGFIMGLFNMSIFFGLSVGPLLGGLINDHFSMYAAFICMGALAMVGYMMSLTLLPPTREEHGARRSDDRFSWGSLLHDSDVYGMFIFRFAHTTCIGIIWGFLPLYASIRFSLSTSAVGVLVMLGVFTSGLLQMPMGLLADRLNRRGMVGAGGIVIVAALFLLLFADGFRGLLAASVVFGIGGGIAIPALMALGVTKGTATGGMGSIMALLTMAHSLGMLTGSLLAGLIMDWFRLALAFPLGAAVMTLSTAVFLWCTRRMVPAAQVSRADKQVRL